MLLILGGCSSLNIPKYIQADYPYKHRFYSDFDNVMEATSTVLQNFGWVIGDTLDPSVYEAHEGMEDSRRKQKLIFTDVHQESVLFIGKRYARLNIYLREGVVRNVTEVEIRYLTVNPLFFKDFNNYRKDDFIEQIFQRIEELL